MVDVATFNALSGKEQAEFRALAPQLIKAAKRAGIADGLAFEEKYLVMSRNGVFFLSDGETPFAGITSASRRVIEALQADVAQNLSR